MSKSFSEPISISVRVCFWGASAFFLFSMAILGHASVRAFAWSLPLCALGVYLGRLNATSFLRAFFVLLPVTGFLSLIFEVTAVPFMLPFFWGGLASWCLKNFSTNQALVFPAPVWVYGAGLLLSTSWALFSLSEHIPHLSAIVVALPWADIPLKNALGWILLSLGTSLSGVFLFSWLMSEKRILEKTIPFLFIGILIAFAAGLLQLLGFKGMNAPIPFKNNEVYQFNATFSNPNILGLFSALVLPLWLSLAVKRNAPWYVRVAGLELVVLLGMASSRSAYFLCAIAAVILILRYFFTPKRALNALLVVFLVFSAVLFIYQMEFAPTRLHVLLRDGIEVIRAERPLAALWGDRTHLWKAGWVTFTHNIPLGTGLGLYLIKMPSYGPALDTVANDNCGNMYLQVAAEQGVVGLAIFLFLLGSFAMQFLRGGIRGESLESVAAFGSFAGLCAAFLFGAHLLSFEINILFWCLLAVIYEKDKGDRAAWTKMPAFQQGDSN